MHFQRIEGRDKKGTKRTGIVVVFVHDNELNDTKIFGVFVKALIDDAKQVGNDDAVAEFSKYKDLEIPKGKVLKSNPFFVYHMDLLEMALDKVSDFLQKKGDDGGAAGINSYVGVNFESVRDEWFDETYGSDTELNKKGKK